MNKKQPKRFAYYEESNASSNYANPLYITHYPDGSTMSTMEEKVARKAVNQFNQTADASQNREGMTWQTDGKWMKELQAQRDQARNHADKLAEALRGLAKQSRNGWICPEDVSRDFEKGWKAACYQFAASVTLHQAEITLAEWEKTKQ